MVRGGSARSRDRFESRSLRAHTMEQLIARIAQRKPIPVIALIGTDAYLRDLCRKKIIEAFTDPASREWNLSQISVREAGWDDVFDRAQTLPMMSKCQVVIVEDVHSVEKLGDDSRERVVKLLADYLNSPAPFTVLVLQADALDGRQKFAKLIDERALTVELEIGPESASSLAIQMAGDLGTDLDRPAAALLADALNGEPARMRIEIEKMAAYVGVGGRISSEDVQRLVVAARKNTVWQLADLIAERRRDAALVLLQNLLREGEPPPMIVGALAFRYRVLIEGGGRPSWGYQGQRQLAVPGTVPGMGGHSGKPLTQKELLAGLEALAEADSELKSSNPDPRATLEFLITRLTSPATSAARAR